MREIGPSDLRQAGTDASWWRTVTADLARREYAATMTPTGLQAPNRAQNLRTTFAAGGIAVVPRTGKEAAPAWRFAWETSGIGRAGAMEAVEPTIPELDGARVTYRHEGWTEWYENTAKGLEQGFTLDRRPAGDGRLLIAGTISGALKAQAGEDGAIDFIDAHGARVIRYGELEVWDARGTKLPSRMAASGTGGASGAHGATGARLVIEVDDRDAAYPIRIDPLMTSPAWTAESNQAGALLGTSVAGAGDVNGDGYSDVIVGAFSYDGEQVDLGQAFVYHGSANGLSLAPDWSVQGDQSGALFAFSVASAGDVNGDGYSDVIIGSPAFSNGQTNEGRAFVYHGSAAGLESVASWTAESDQAGALLGLSVAMAGDVNGDGYSDVIVGAGNHDNGQANEGRAYVYQGSASGLSPAAAWTAESDVANAQFGSSVATAGDVNGDGYADVIVGAYTCSNGQTSEGRAYVYQGAAAGLSSTANWTAESDQAHALFGWSVATAGDVNGDGYSEIIVGAEGFDNGQADEGRVYVYMGSPGGLSLLTWIAESNQAGAQLGSSVAPAGDVNGDGYADVIVAALTYDNGQTDEGRVFLFQGSANGLAGSPTWTAESDQAGARLGVSASAAGDVNGDGYTDVIIGADSYDNGQIDEGRAFVYHGEASGPSLTSNWTEESDQARAFFGFSVASAGDVNGDGYSDVIVGAPLFDSGQTDEGKVFVYEGSAGGLSLTPAWDMEGDQENAVFGISVATAGDVNGDGYSDVIAGSYYANGEPNEGRALVYHGSPSGLAASPAWSAEGDQAEAYFSWVATAGDVNGDGYSDVIVGANFFDNGETEEGKAFVYHGSAAGLEPTPAWTAEGDQVSAIFGSRVATAGDVNGDGYSDVIVCATWYDNGQTDEGRTYVYHGSSAGLSAAPAWTSEGDQTFARFGSSAATAGDVNGDGFSDVIVGAYLFDNGQVDEGRAFVYLGSASGLGLTPAWTAESDQTAAEFGICVATAGDVNGDGFSDVIVGAHWYDNGQTSEGRAYVYHGSAAGLSTSPAWSAESDQPGAELGSAVATAGDVNGDGFSDVIIGAYFHDNGQTDEGRAFVYCGNGGDGLERMPRQARTDDSAPIACLGRSDSESAFLLKALGRTAVGRGRVQLQCEVKPLGTPFDGSQLITGPTFDTGTPVPGIGSAVPLSELAGGLLPETPYKWRLRILSNSQLIPFTPWFSLPDDNVTETDLRTGIGITDVEPAGEATNGPLRITASHPNPFGRSTVIHYSLPRSGPVRLAVYDATGRECAVLVNGVQAAGSHQVIWGARVANGGGFPAGAYFARLVMDGQVVSRKLILVP